MAMANRRGKKSWLAYIIPKWIMRRLYRYMFLTVGMILYQFLQRDTGWMAKFMMRNAESQLPPSIPMDPHFTPKYKPWTQRVGVSPDGDFFEALRNGKAGVATGVIKQVTEDSIVLESGEVVGPLDIIVTATVGLPLSFPHHSWVFNSLSGVALAIRRNCRVLH
jgi:cation diffusion facilitator CzcD-associated flavoprotein CzcO